MRPQDEIDELKRRVKTLDVLLDDYTERIRRLEGWARPVELENHLLRRHLMRNGASFHSFPDRNRHEAGCGDCRSVIRATFCCGGQMARKPGELVCASCGRSIRA